jgi:hypothetical protein
LASWRHGTVRAVDVLIGTDGFDVRIKDGRRLFVPFSWFPRLEVATPAQRSRWQLIGNGIGIHWPELDEDLSIAGLLHGTRPVRFPIRSSRRSATV